MLARAVDDLRQAAPGKPLTVIGYTDATGTTAYNLSLSKRRAQAVARALRVLLGPDVSMTVSGRGEADPVASNNTAAGRALNRRVSIVYQEG